MEHTLTRYQRRMMIAALEEFAGNHENHMQRVATLGAMIQDATTISVTLPDMPSEHASDRLVARDYLLHEDCSTIQSFADSVAKNILEG